MKKVSKKQTPYNTIFLSKIIGLVLLTLFLFFIWDMSKPHLQATNGQATIVTSSDFRDTSISLKAKDHSARTLDQQFKTNPNQQTTNKTVFLTFDDGPSATSNQLLNILKAHQVKATFFMLGPQIQAHQATVKRLYQEGHQLGLHGMTHDINRFYQNSESPANEMREAQLILASVTGVYTRLVRTPYGSVPNLTYDQKVRLNQYGFIYWDWTIDSLDWRYKNSQYVQEVLNQLQMFEKNKPWEPKVILMHDQPSTTNYLDSLITQLKARGYTFAVINETMPPVQH
ncbi:MULTISPECIES: polysaccharide deacetylase family protein [Bacillus]|uniref:polysaccharide deacetylase family protein n=1 Tax=Bacillus TaxID=1386 RepID=UPI00093882C0|nr:polysaccharide deacetylase family protein [Bacillus altitudinis]MDH8710724.1 peptidoglycan/xylan/chitin deacetylase (PgdA/CDA1 family) [Micromonospora sp. 1209]WOQ71761.1 polysaccharide deacetylase family protein [Bacillus stratosphericus]APP16763.1 polysaccharide deacetylase [Bacillus altitudinis]MBG9903594.1 polysaccharide deacetylase [Bacillus altitudinis]MBL7242248.1 polysaccharide deacetylase [Bacillus altitudinis]